MPPEDVPAPEPSPSADWSGPPVTVEPRAPAQSAGRHRARHRADDDDDDDLDVVAETDGIVELPSTGRHFLAPDPIPLDPDVSDPRVTEVARAAAAARQSAGAALLPEERPEPPSAPPRAGRNLPAAIGVGVALGVVVLLSLLLYRPSFVVIVVLAAAYGTYELVTAISTVEARPPLIPLVIGGAAMDISAWYRGPNGLVVALLLTVVAVAVWRLAEGAGGYLRDVGAAVFVALYVPFLCGFAVLMVHAHDGAGRVICFIVLVVCNDVGGYVAGVFAGKHPMAPTVSPKKSWEGFAGSVLAGAVGGALFALLLFHVTWWHGVLLGLAVIAVATLGDLGESMIKRDLGLKDMGRLLPGHGGLMDRLDSLLPCAVVAYLLLVAFVPL